MLTLGIGHRVLEGESIDLGIKHERKHEIIFARTAQSQTSFPRKQR